jgi:hypothetical protein
MARRVASHEDALHTAWRGGSSGGFTPSHCHQVGFALSLYERKPLMSSELQRRNRFDARTSALDEMLQLTTKAPPVVATGTRA